MRGLTQLLGGLVGTILGGLLGLALGGGLGIAIGCTLMPDSNLCGIFCIVTGPIGAILGILTCSIAGKRLAKRQEDPAEEPNPGDSARP